MTDIPYLIRDLFHVLKNGGTFQDFINRRYNKTGLDEWINFENIETVTTKDGIVFPLRQVRTNPIQFINEVYSDYDLSDLRPDDIVLDVGANIGCFSLLAAKKAKFVYASEPVFYKELTDNIIRNNVSNVRVSSCALSPGEFYLEFDGRKKYVYGISLTDFKNICGGHVDFLKCDCEGGEWCIKPEELEGIRRIEAEVHTFNGEDWTVFYKMLENVGFEVQGKRNGIDTALVHAWRKA